MSKYIKLLGLNLFVMFIFLFTVIITNSSNFEVERADITIIITFLIIGLISIIGIINDKNSYSINLMHWLFIYIFIFNAGIIQYLKNDFPWQAVLDNTLILKANLVIIAWCIFYYISYNLKSFSPKIMIKRDITIKNKWLLVSITILIGLFFINYVGVSNLFARSELETQTQESIKSAQLVMMTCVRAIPVVVLAYLIKEKQLKNERNSIYITIIFLLNLIVNFPSGSARYWAASIYMGLYLMLKPQKNDKFFFCILFISVFLVGFPLLNAFRNMTFEEVLEGGIKFSNFVDFFLQGDFDAYSMICRSLQMVTQIGSSSGKQLLGALLFFIPRSLWPSKPIGSGATIAYYQGQYFTNISCPIISEGVMNFGIIGVAIFSVLIAFIIKYLDTLYWNGQKENQGKINAITILYPFHLGFFFFIFRGDLMSSFAYLVGFSVSAFVAQIVFGRAKQSLDTEKEFIAILPKK
ncbi:O-antigen polymerase [Intestinibacter sp.]